MSQQKNSTPAFVVTVKQGRIVLPITMLDPIIHTEAHPFCSDSSYPCQEEREAQRAKLPLNGNKGFSLYR